MCYIEQVKKDGFDIIRMNSSNNTIIMELNPTRGNIISSLMFKNKQMIYIDKENYMSTERPRCGSPVLFPFAGLNDDNKLSLYGKTYKTGIHGIVHTNKWVVNKFYNDDKMCAVELYTESDNTSKISFPFEFRLDSKIILQDNEIIYETKITNLSQKTMPCDLGFHPFFIISHLNNLNFDFRADTIYDPVTKARKQYTKLYKTQIKNNGIILEKCNNLKITDKVRKINIEFYNEKEFENYMLWTGNEAKFIVVEPLTSIPNSINDKVNKFNLVSGESINCVWKVKFNLIN